jgi:hypothetical protein
MHRMKRIVATLLLLVVIGLGTPQVFAGDGPSETPTVGVKITTEISDPTGETPSVVASIIYFLSTLIP